MASKEDRNTWTLKRCTCLAIHTLARAEANEICCVHDAVTPRAIRLATAIQASSSPGMAAVPRILSVAARLLAFQAAMADTFWVPADARTDEDGTKDKPCLSVDAARLNRPG